MEQILEVRIKHNVLISSDSIQKIPLTTQNSIFKINTDPYYPVDVMQSQNSDPFAILYNKQNNTFLIYNSLDMEKLLLTCQAFTRSSKFEAYVALKDGVYHVKAFNKKLQKNKIISLESVFSLSFNQKNYQLAVQTTTDTSIFDLNSMKKLSAEQPNRHYTELISNSMTPDSQNLPQILYNSYGNCEFSLPAKIRIANFAVNFDAQKERQLFGIDNDLIYYSDGDKIYFFDGITGMCMGMKVGFNSHAVRVFGSRIYVMSERQFHIYEMPIFVNFQQLQFAEFVEYSTGIICLNDGISYVLDFKQNKTFCFENLEVNDVIIQSEFVYLENDILYILQPGGLLEVQPIIKTMMSPLFQEKTANFKLKIDKDLCFALELDETMDNVLKQLEDFQVELDAGVNVVQQKFGIGARDYSVDDVLSLAVMNIKLCDNLISDRFYEEMAQLNAAQICVKEDSLQVSVSDMRSIEKSIESVQENKEIDSSKTVFDYSLNSPIQAANDRSQISITAETFRSQYQMSMTSQRLLSKKSIAQSTAIMPTLQKENPQFNSSRKIDVVDFIKKDVSNKLELPQQESINKSLNRSILSQPVQNILNSELDQSGKILLPNKMQSMHSASDSRLHESIMDYETAEIVVGLFKAINDSDHFSFVKITSELKYNTRLQIAEIYESYYQFSIQCDIMTYFTGKFSQIVSLYFSPMYDAWSSFLATQINEKSFQYLIYLIQPHDRASIQDSYIKITGQSLIQDISSSLQKNKEFLIKWFTSQQSNTNLQYNINTIDGIENLLTELDVANYKSYISTNKITLTTLPEYLQIAHNMKIDSFGISRKYVIDNVPNLQEALTVLVSEKSKGSQIRFDTKDSSMNNLLNILWNK
ncbi:hypothetical protein SS50377_24688 [Spironucleus salmonicida]|uniref:Uncharacterized protein n=1 Tax=Spironucleus salmonicida TaxID=348837 RepID=V6LL83_9EUKA|nr:hypothetical protein SS50377_24688 [Spironucleus salmonicida]|eukprot:EST44496.1 Hypothetical protein SS50377_15494 [Spironucleus salmonicida]